MEKPEQESRDSGFSQYGKALRVAGPLFGSGIQLAASVILMFFIGRWLDSEFNTYPWLILLAIFFGLGAGLYNFVKIVNRVEKKRTKDK